MNKARQTQRHIFKMFRMAKVTGFKARYLQGIWTEYGELKSKRDKKSRNFCKFVEQASKIYKDYKQELLVATEDEKKRFEAWRNRLRAIGHREVIGGITGITRARA